MKSPHSSSYKSVRILKLCLPRSEGALLCLRGERLRPLVLLKTAMVEWCWQGRTEEIGQKPTPVPIRLQQNSQGLARDLIQVFAVRRKRQEASTTARPNNDRSSSKMQFHFIFFSISLQPLVGQEPLTVENSLSHSDTSYSVGLPWTRDLPDAQTYKDIHAPGRIRTLNPSKHAAVSPHLRPRKFNSYIKWTYFFLLYKDQQVNDVQGRGYTSNSL